MKCRSTGKVGIIAREWTDGNVGVEWKGGSREVVKKSGLIQITRDEYESAEADLLSICIISSSSRQFEGSSFFASLLEVHHV